MNPGPNPTRHVEALVHHLVTALVNLDLHARDSQHVASNLMELRGELATVLEQTGSSCVELQIGATRVLLEGRPLLGASLQASNLLRLCHERHVRELRIHAGVDSRELLEFLELLKDPGSKQAFTPACLAGAMRAHRTG